ncbi:uncharacterized protein DUF3866 [Marinisporobacter balticus]|uniref:Uncharacterized protein DUF3866 n=1 Tax=Marinisporobacter balticus TaxID=2018667 RepID=A0A4R2L0A7_9FIRM|nr:DUF3866 family protein [Marinisporobacter balticus]TCO79834.1 uncharacterized protein DUF3866 [Marinisporobacter balticus]
MIGVKIGKAIEILEEGDNKTEVLVKINDKHDKAVNYNRLTGRVRIGDDLLLNTTAVDLNLGTGGYHFVLSNLDRPSINLSPGGHIMKLRYSPFQVKVCAAEEQESIYHEVFKTFQSLNHMPVVIGTLHSMLPPIIEVLKANNKNIKIAYIMTDGAALPIDLSNIVKDLKEKVLIEGTITIGNAFGGDLDCVNIYNGLIAAKDILKCDIVVVTMGPGIVGTATQFGFSGIEQGNIIDAVNDLGGTPIAVPRITFADMRKRHSGMSHHTLTVLDKISKTKAFVGIPKFEKSKNEYISSQINHTSIQMKHKIIHIDPVNVTSILEKSTLNMRTMGRSFQKDKEFFITAGVAAQLGIMVLNDPQLDLLK